MYPTIRFDPFIHSTTLGAWFQIRKMGHGSLKLIDYFMTLFILAQKDRLTSASNLRLTQLLYWIST